MTSLHSAASLCRLRPASAASPFGRTALRRRTSPFTALEARRTVSSLPGKVVYEGPLTNTFKYLKIFSLSSLALSTALSPFIFILESSVPMSGRILLAATAISTTTLSTWLISTFTSPYVTHIRTLPSPSSSSSDAVDSPSYILSTTSLLLRPIHTSIVSPAALEPSERPLTTWKLATRVGAEDGVVAAWTEDEHGTRVGRWVVGAEGECRGEGKVVRYFNVHQELIKDESIAAGVQPSSIG